MPCTLDGFPSLNIGVRIVQGPNNSHNVAFFSNNYLHTHVPCTRYKYVKDANCSLCNTDIGQSTLLIMPISRLILRVCDGILQMLMYFFFSGL